VPPSDYFREPQANLGVVVGATVLLVLSGLLAGWFPARLAAKVGRTIPVIIDEVGEPDEDGDVGATGRSAREGSHDHRP